MRQTCEVARDFCRWKVASGDESDRPAVVCACMLSPYSSHDPAPADPKTDGLSTPVVGDILRDTSKPLFERYGAMFALRNRGGDGAVVELGKALIEDTSSALLRHEVAYVLGQMQLPAALIYLEAALKREYEHNMVRHEAAEALGALIFNEADETGELKRNDLLKYFGNEENEKDAVVRESCEVALDAEDYWSEFTKATASNSSTFAHQKAQTLLHFNSLG